MSKIKYPEKSAIRKEINEILDKSELFSQTSSSGMRLERKTVKLEPVKEGLSVRKIAAGALAVVAVAAVIVFVTAVNNYSQIGSGRRGTSQMPLATVEESSTQEVADYESEELGESEEESYAILYKYIESESLISIEDIRSEYKDGVAENADNSGSLGCSTMRHDSMLYDGDLSLEVDVPIDITYEGEVIEGADRKVWEAVDELLTRFTDQYVATGRDDYVKITYNFSVDDVLIQLERSSGLTTLNMNVSIR